MQGADTVSGSFKAPPSTARLGLAPFREVFGADLRTLALFRVLLGGFVIIDLCLRARDLRAHYTDFGIMPRQVLVDYLAPASFSIHMLNGTAFFQAVLFLLAGTFGLMLMIGWRTRLATIASWFLLLSLQNRNPVILSGEDNLVMVLMFWAMFLPLGARFSVDAALDRNSEKTPNAFFSVATVALLIQGMSMYFFSALLKSDPIWMPDGTAVYYALQLDYFATPLTLWFRQFEALLTGLTYYVWTLELVGPVLIFSPILHRPLRAALMVAFITMHLGFFLFLNIGIFPLISIIMVLTFTPGWMWDLVGRRLNSSRQVDLHIWFDRDCDFCLKTVRLLQTLLCLSRVPARPAQEEPRFAATLQAHNSWVVSHADAEYIRWDAVRHLVACSPIFWPLANLMAVMPFRRFGDRFYLWIAANRPALSRLTAAVIPWRTMRIAPTRPASIVVGLLLVFVTTQNVTTHGICAAVGTPTHQVVNS